MIRIRSPRASMCKLAILGALLALAASAVEAQRPGAAGQRGTIQGEVIDAETSLPLSGAAVTLVPAPAGAILGDPESAFIAAAKTTTTGALGTYRFSDLPYGDYNLRVQRIGYRPVSIEVQLRGTSESRVSVGLSVIPVRLQPQEVRSEAPQPYARAEAETEYAGLARIAAARQRQREYVSTDVREVTHPDVHEAVTLAETDLFRALNRLPGVSSRDDFGAELWTRGGRWDHTRVQFDGLPLYDPYHAFGAFSAVEANALGAAFLHPGVRPARLGEGGAGVLDLRSRAGGGDGEVRGVGELSLISTRVALDQRTVSGRTGWMVAARRTYIDWLTAAIDPEASLPFYFGDVVARVDRHVGEQGALEASVLASRDAQTGDTPDVAQGNRAAWGNAAARLTLAAPLLGGNARHTVGVSRFMARIDTVPPDPALGQQFSTGREFPLRTSMLHATFTGELEPLASAAGRTWTAGYAIIAEQAHFDGYADQLFTDVELSTDRLVRTTATVRGGMWGERVWRPGARLQVNGGLRVDAGTPIANAGVVRPMPRVQARYTLDRSTTVSAAVGRSWQYAQAISRPERGASSVIYPSRFWMLADDTTAALRTDLVTLGAERWLGADWLATTNLYARRAAGMLMSDPRPGERTDRPLAVTGRERAHGAEAGVRKLSGRVTGSLGYTYGAGFIDAVDLSFPSSQDRRHSVDATLMARATRTFSIGGAYTFGSAFPYTRATRGRGTLDDEGRITWMQPPFTEDPNAMRARAYGSLDLLADWAFRVRGARVATFLQLRNVLNQRNDAIYIEYDDCMDGGQRRPGCVPQDRFERGLPMLPVIGFRMSF